MDFKKTNAAEMKQKSDEITDKIRAVRTKVNAIFDVLEENIGSNSKALAKKCCIETEEEMTKLSNIIKTLEEQDKFIECYENAGSSSQRYIVMDKIMQKTDEIEQKFRNIAKESRIFEAELKLERALDTFVNLDLNDTDRLASVKEKALKHPVPGLQFMEQLQKVGTLVKEGEYAIMSVDGCYNQQYYSVIFIVENKEIYSLLVGVIITNVAV